MPDTALEDVRIIDLTQHIAGPYATKLLADYGAEVIKVERPEGGDPARRVGPFFHDDPHPEKSGLFLYLNTNKKSITLNLKSAKGREILLELVKDADLLVESYSPRVMPGLGLGYEELEKVNPRLVMVSISNFGQYGPYRDYKMSDLLLYALGGSMSVTGLAEREPIRLGLYVITMQAGNVAATAALGGFFGSRYQGVGQHLDVALMQVQAGTIDRGGTSLISVAYSGRAGGSRAGIAPARTILPSGVQPSKDGYVSVSGGRPDFWRRFCLMIGKPELIDDPHFTGDNIFNVDLKPEVDALFLEWSMERSKQEVMEQGEEYGFAVTAINTMEDFFRDPHHRQRGYFVPIDHPVVGTLEYPGPPFRMMESPRREGPAPLLGEHNEAIYCGRLGITKQELAQLRALGVI